MRCAMCGVRTESKTEINFMEIWKEQHEWSVFPRRGIVCKGCLQWAREEGFKEFQLYNEPLPMVVGPQKFWSDMTDIGIGIYDGKLLSLRCAKKKYGVDAVEEIMQGFCYEGLNGNLIERAATGLVDEREKCEGEGCKYKLFECNKLGKVLK